MPTPEKDTTAEQGVFTYEDYLALPEEEKQRIDNAVDEMSDEELTALGERVADFIYLVDYVDHQLARFEGD